MWKSEYLMTAERLADQFPPGIERMVLLAIGETLTVYGDLLMQRLEELIQLQKPEVVTSATPPEQQGSATEGWIGLQGRSDEEALSPTRVTTEHDGRGIFVASEWLAGVATFFALHSEEQEARRLLEPMMPYLRFDVT